MFLREFLDKLETEDKLVRIKKEGVSLWMLK